MSIIESIQKRRSYYQINNVLSHSEEELVTMFERVTELVPDAFNMKSSHIVVVFGEKQVLLWDTIYDIFEGIVSQAKIDSFKSGAGTILYFYDESVVETMQAQFIDFADNFPGWALQASGMLQFSIWTALRDLGIGASLQHYNPIIDQKIKALFEIPQQYKLIAQMPFGGIISEPDAKEAEDISKRVRILR